MGIKKPHRLKNVIQGRLKITLTFAPTHFHNRNDYMNSLILSPALYIAPPATNKVFWIYMSERNPRTKIIHMSASYFYPCGNLIIAERERQWHGNLHALSYVVKKQVCSAWHLGFVAEWGCHSYNSVSSALRALRVRDRSGGNHIRAEPHGARWIGSTSTDTTSAHYTRPRVCNWGKKKS